MKGFEVKKVTPKSKFIKMLKLKDSNKMHFDPSPEIIKMYNSELASGKNSLANEEDQDGDLCAICYTEKIDAVF